MSNRAARMPTAVFQPFQPDVIQEWSTCKYIKYTLYIIITYVLSEVGKITGGPLKFLDRADWPDADPALDKNMY